MDMKIIKLHSSYLFMGLASPETQVKRDLVTNTLDVKIMCSVSGLYVFS